MDDERHLEVTAVPASALVAAPESGRPPGAGRKREAPTVRPEPEEGDDRAEPDEREQFDELESGPATGWPTRFGRINGLKVALSLAVAVALALAGTLYLTLRQSDDERTITAAIERYAAAWNAHDLNAVHAALYSGGEFVASDNISHEALFIASWGPELDRVLTALFAANIKLETVGRVIYAGRSRNIRASVVQRFSYNVYGLRAVEEGISQYTLSPAEHGPSMKIVQHVWWRPRVPAAPSMLWILDAQPQAGG